MKINEVLTESQQLDELSAAGIGTALGKTGQAIGGTLGGLAGAWDAAKSGYQSGRAFVGGQRIGSGSPKGPSYSGGSAPTARTVTYPQVVDAIPNMNADELKNLKQKIDTALQSPVDQGGGSAASAAQSNPTKAQQGMWTDINGKKYMFAGNTWVDERNAIAKGEDLNQIKSKLAAGEIPPASAERPPELGGKATQSVGSGPIPGVQDIVKGISKLKPDQVDIIRDMLTAKVQGQQNVAEGIGSAIKAGWNKLTGRGGLSFDQIKQAIDQMSLKDAQGLLDQLPVAPAAKPSGQGLPGLTAPTLQPKPTGNVTTNLGSTSKPGSITTGGINRPQGTATPSTGKPLPSPAAEKNPPAGGKPVPGPAASAEPKATPSLYGNLTPDEQKFVAAREKEGVEPEIIKQALANRKNRKPVSAPKGGPEKTQAKRKTDYKFYPQGGINPSTKLSDIGPVGAAAKRTAANEGFYSKFLDKKI